MEFRFERDKVSMRHSIGPWSNVRFHLGIFARLCALRFGFFRPALPCLLLHEHCWVHHEAGIAVRRLTFFLEAEQKRCYSGAKQKMLRLCGRTPRPAMPSHGDDPVSTLHHWSGGTVLQLDQSPIPPTAYFGVIAIAFSIAASKALASSGLRRCSAAPARMQASQAPGSSWAVMMTVGTRRFISRR